MLSTQKETPKSSLNASPHHASVNERRATEIAAVAIDKIKQWRLPATPKNFELCFAYSSNENPTLVQAVDAIVKSGGGLPSADAHQLYTRFIRATDIGDRINSAGMNLYHETFQVLEAIDCAVDATDLYGSDVERVRSSLVATKNSAELKAMAVELAQAVATFKTINSDLEARLRASRLEIHDLQEKLSTLRAEAQTDPLTGLTNRQTLDVTLADKLRAFKKTNEPLSVIMCDIDHFRNFNNRWGHLVGDQVLRLVASTLRASFKGRDVVARYGGEEFAIVLPNTPLAAASIVAEQVRCAVMSSHVRNRSTGVDMGQVTLSIGVAEAGPADTAESLIARADSCLYEAKRTGRNRSVSQRTAASSDFAQMTTAN